LKDSELPSLITLPLVGLEYSGKSTILHQMRANHAGQTGSFCSLFSFQRGDQRFDIITRFNSMQDEFRNFPVELLVDKCRGVFRKHIGNVDVFIPAMCVLINRNDGTLRSDYISLPLMECKRIEQLHTALIFLNVSPGFLIYSAPQVYKNRKIAERAVAEFERLKLELEKDFICENINGDRSLTQLKDIVNDLEKLIIKYRKQFEDA
jgi:hypothetical protein